MAWLNFDTNQDPQYALALWIRLVVYNSNRLKRCALDTSTTNAFGGTNRLPGASTRL